MRATATPGDGVPDAVPIARSSHATQTPESGTPARTRATTTTRMPVTSPARTGRRGLNAVRESLSARDWDVLKVADAHRYLTTKQVEAFCFANHASQLTAARVARRVLRRLAALHVISHLDRRIGGIRAGSASFVWRVGPVGDRLLREADSSARQRQREPGRLFLDHCLAVADAHLALIRPITAARLSFSLYRPNRSAGAHTPGSAEHGSSYSRTCTS
jgi:hypothetical protein